jgi:hypothetical protein
MPCNMANNNRIPPNVEFQFPNIAKINRIIVIGKLIDNICFKLCIYIEYLNKFINFSIRARKNIATNIGI